MQYILLLCLLSLSLSAEEKPKNLEKITVYLESLCPDCQDFIKKSFAPFHENVQKDVVEIEFVPYGNANEYQDPITGQYYFECQHGESECYGNLMETCALNKLEKRKAFTFMICLENNIKLYGKNWDRVLGICLDGDQEAQTAIKNCMKSDEGNKYQHEMAQKTGPHRYVPWILVDDRHDVKAEEEILKSMTNYVCSKKECY